MFYTSFCMAVVYRKNNDITLQKGRQRLFIGLLAVFFREMPYKACVINRRRKALSHKNEKA